MEKSTQIFAITKYQKNVVSSFIFEVYKKKHFLYFFFLHENMATNYYQKEKERL